MLQNAVTATATATDRQMDALVYELYGLTQGEIPLAENGGKYFSPDGICPAD